MRISFVAICASVLMVFLQAPPLAASHTPTDGADTSLKSAQLTVQAISTMPLAFTENHGQWDDRVLFQARTHGMIIWFTKDGVTYGSIRRTGLVGGRGISRQPREVDPDGVATDSIEQQVIRSSFAGANPNPEIVGEEEMDYKCNYFYGNDAAKWHVDVPNYNRIVYHDLYPGIDLSFYGRNGAIEYDFIVHPGADASAIALRYEGVQATSIDRDGNLVLVTAQGELVHHVPQLYEILPDGGRVPAVGAFCLSADGVVRFDLPERQSPTLALVIDPVLSYSTYLGGGNYEDGNGIAVDVSGNAYVAGYTGSANFPTVNPYQAGPGGGDAFVTKLNAAGTLLVYSTYLGGSDGEAAHGIAIDSSGNAYIAGETNSTNFPTLHSYQTFQGGSDAFVTKLNSSGNALVYSTCLGGSDWDLAEGIAIDGSHSTYVTGLTKSTDFPTVNPVQANQGGATGTWDAFVAKLTSSGDSLVYSTYLGGSDDDLGYGIAVDGGGNAYVTGSTASTNFPTAFPFQAPNHGGSDAFVTKLNAAGSSLTYSTYLGGIGNECGYGIAVDGSGNAYVTGFTGWPDFPTVNPSQSYGGGTDAFVTKLNAAGSSLIYSTFLGGAGIDIGYGICVDAGRNAYVTGETSSSDFPTIGSYLGGLRGANDAFVTKLASTGNINAYSTYLGGSMNDAGSAIAVDLNGLAYVTGFTWSSDFPLQNPYDATLTGPTDAFVVKLRPAIRVTSLADAGSGTLRDAINATNANPGNDSITFGIAGTIHLLSPLPSLTDTTGPVYILGYTAPGAVSPYTPTVVLDGSAATPGAGLLVTSSGNWIEGLTFSNFHGAGVAVTDASSVSNKISRCRFYGNSGPGIDLGNDGITLNDPGDLDTGPNGLQNYPVFDSVQEAAPGSFTVFGTASANAYVEVYLAAESGNLAYQPESTNHGPAYKYLGGALADSVGHFLVQFIPEPQWSQVTAMEIGSGLNSSEFSLNKLLVADPMRITALSEPVPPLKTAAIMPEASPAVQMKVTGPPNANGISDSIGPTFNTFGSRAKYDSTTDFNTGGLVDTRVTILSPDPGTYSCVYTLIGSPGTYLTGIGIDGHADIHQKITFGTAGQAASATFTLAPPVRGELTSDGVIDVFDVIKSIDIVFGGQAMPDPPELIDVNCDAVADVFDVIYLIDYTFAGGLAPCQ